MQFGCFLFCVEYFHWPCSGLNCICVATEFTTLNEFSYKSHILPNPASIDMPWVATIDCQNWLDLAENDEL